MLTPAVVERIYHVHVNNMNPTPPEYAHCNNDRLLPDDPEGVFDLKALFRTIEAAGYTGDFSIEMFSNELREQSPAEAARRLHESLQGLVA
jgi:sugar phosphate isomerase/epimerase